MTTASTIPYQLRPHKAIERNLFVSILKKLDRYSKINIHDYRYVGFGAPFLEDFKSLHVEFGIENMDCIEYDKLAYSRQVFNNPYHFVKLHNDSSTNYINGATLKQDRNQIIWLDFASPKEFRQQLKDAELISEKLSSLDILKFTFNSHIAAFISSHYLRCKPYEFNVVLKLLKNDPTYQRYLPDSITSKNLADNFPAVLRAMGMRAIKRGLAKAGNNFVFNHIAAFNYADGQQMTTMTGILSSEQDFKDILIQSNFKNWEFYESEPKTELIPGNEISVPAMTISERIEIDKLIPAKSIASIASALKFSFGNTNEDHLKLLQGYCRYYKYLPYYSKVTY